ncbi:MAG: DNA topoisomerase [Christensenellaceae bacterium]
MTEAKKSTRQRKAYAPFTTSTLQQDAARKLGFTTKRTMMVAQGLYEGVKINDSETVGLITYMRTDSTRISEEARAAAKEQILGALWRGVLPGQAKYLRRAQECAGRARGDPADLCAAHAAEPQGLPDGGAVQAV